MMHSMEIRSMKNEDWPAVMAIYQEGIETGFATFEKELPGFEAWDNNHLKSCRIVAEKEGKVIGWAALSPVSSRCVYGGVAEVSIYVGQAARGLGVGKRLMNELISLSENEGLWTLQSGIFPENEASIKLHEQLGFRRIGFRERVGKLDGVWKDNIIFEKRSKVVGTD